MPVMTRVQASGLRRYTEEDRISNRVEIEWAAEWPRRRWSSLHWGMVAIGISIVIGIATEVWR